MKQFTDTRDKERRAQKIVEKQNLQHRKQIKDRHYHVVDEDDEESQIEQEYEHFIKGKNHD